MSTQPPSKWNDFQYDRLESIPRELRFHPSDPAASTTLSDVDVARYNTDGYLTSVPFLPSEEAADLRTYFDGLLASTLAAGESSYSISTAHRKHRRVYDLATDERILDVVADILGNEFVLWGTHFFCKLPGDGKAVAWHQDASYWPLTPSKTVTVWLAVDDSDCQNGCMQVLPKSHLHGHLDWKPTSAGDQNVLDQAVINAESYGEPPVNIELAAGQVSLHSDLLLHGSHANQSDRRRCGLTIRYAAMDVRAHLGWNEKGVVCRGHDTDGHWADFPAPARE